MELFHGRSGASDKTVLTSNASSSTTTATRNHYVPCGYPSFLRQPTPLKRICARVPTSWLYQYSELVRRNCTLGPCLLRQSTGGFVVESYSREVHETNVVQFSSQNCTLHVWSSLTFRSIDRRDCQFLVASPLTAHSKGGTRARVLFQSPASPKRSTIPQHTSRPAMPTRSSLQPHARLLQEINDGNVRGAEEQLDAGGMHECSR